MFSLFGIQLHLYGLVIGIGLLVAIFIVEKIIKREKIAVQIDPLFIPTLLSGVIGARLYHLVTDWHLYQDASLLELVAIWNGGLGIIGGLLGGAIGLWLGLRLRKRQEFFLPLVDSIAISLPIAQAIGRWGNFFNQELFGFPTQLPWAVFIDHANRPATHKKFEYFHPLFLYESVLNLLLFGILWRLYVGNRLHIGQGKLLGVYLMGYGVIRFILEFGRIETARWNNPLGMLSIAQWMMIGLILIGTTLVTRSLWLKKNI